MSEEPNNGLKLDDISRRFADSEQSLREAREQLQRLTAAREASERSAASLQESAQAVSSFASSVASLLQELETAQAQTREVLSAGARFLDGSEVKELKETVRAFGERLDQMEQRFLAVENVRAQADQLQAELDRRTAVLSGRQKGKLGLN